MAWLGPLLGFSRLDLDAGRGSHLSELRVFPRLLWWLSGVCCGGGRLHDLLPDCWSGLLGAPGDP